MMNHTTTSATSTGGGLPAGMHARTHADPWTAFGIGVIGGVVGSLSLLSFAGVFAVALIALVGGLELRPRPFGAAGTLLGWAATWLGVLGAAQARCDPASCVGPDLTALVAFSVALATVGAMLVVVGVRRPVWAERATGLGRALSAWRPIRIAIACLLGALCGIWASTLLISGWITVALISLWFAWRHRSPGRRNELAWFAVVALATAVLQVPR